jgi:nucleotide-binding universal stress UspA family protein
MWKNNHTLQQERRMKVILALNGSITSEASAIFAIRYCRLYDYELELVHIKNEKDSLAEVEKSMESVETIAGGAGVACERLFMHGSGVGPLISYVRENRVDTIFCTTRAERGFFAASFSDYLTRRPLPCDVAVVRIADMGALNRVERIGMSIKNAKLSVEKFAFFSSMVRAFEAEGEIYSISVLSTGQRAEMGFVGTRERLESLDAQLSHYRQLAELEGVKLRLKHAFAESETEQILHHSARTGYDLLIVGGRRLSSRSFFTTVTPLERLMRHCCVNMIAYYNGDRSND